MINAYTIVRFIVFPGEFSVCATFFFLLRVSECILYYEENETCFLFNLAFYFR